MLGENRHQHTVPRFYLKRFSNNDKVGIWQFDKSINRWAAASVNSIAAHDKFYSKEILAQFESVYAPSIKKLIEIKNYYALSKADRDGVRLFVNHMEVRTEQAREDILPLLDQFNKHFGTNARLDPRHAQNDMIRNTDRFKRMYVTVMENKTGLQFITSDNPAANFLFEIHIPLTHTLNLALLHKDVFKKVEYVELNKEKHVKYQNLLQMCNARRFTYSTSKFKPSRKTLNAARNWRKDSRYGENNLWNALCVKPNLPGIVPHKFDLLNSNNAQHLKSIQDGTQFKHLSQDRIMNLMWSVVPLQRRSDASFRSHPASQVHKSKMFPLAGTAQIRPRGHILQRSETRSANTSWA